MIDIARRLVSHHALDHPYKAGLGEGLEAMAGAVLDVLEAREIHVDPDTRARITECAALDQLKAWHHRAVTVSSTAEVFA